VPLVLRDRADENNKEMIMNRFRKAALSAVAAGTMLAVTSPAITSAAPPVVATDDGAFVRLVGNPAEGTAKFQFGWSASTPASAAAGYWIGLYDVTNSQYVWVTDTGPTTLPAALSLNAKPTANLPDGEYKVVFFVRGGYEPTYNLAEIELPFTVARSGN
jgi:hypothetical protein